MELKKKKKGSFPGMMRRNIIELLLPLWEVFCPSHTFVHFCIIVTLTNPDFDKTMAGLVNFFFLL